jgi:hypothetical protein
MLDFDLVRISGSTGTSKSWDSKLLVSTAMPPKCPLWACKQPKPTAATITEFYPELPLQALQLK